MEIEGLLKSTRPVGGNHQSLTESRKTERGAVQFLVLFAVRAAPFALRRNSRKTERGAVQLLVLFAVRAAPFALHIGCA
jgi:hypothetical protein